MRDERMRVKRLQNESETALYLYRSGVIVKEGSDLFWWMPPGLTTYRTYESHEHLLHDIAKARGEPRSYVPVRIITASRLKIIRIMFELQRARELSPHQEDPNQ